MSLRLRLTSCWLPKALLLRELDRVAELTTGALDALLVEHAAESLKKLVEEEVSLSRGLEARRAAMAAVHESRVAALVDALGPKEAVQLGRNALFQVGVQLGQEARTRLGVGNGVDDIVRAAKVLYHILGINFEAHWKDEGDGLLIVDRCALAEHYSETTCLVLSAADEGVVQGLNPHVEMSFRERITAGAPRCVARLKFDSITETRL